MENKSSQAIVQLLTKLNKVSVEDALRRGCLPFYISNKQVGLIRPDFWQHLQAFDQVFTKVDAQGTKTGDLKSGVHISSNLTTPAERTKAVNDVLEKLRKDDVIGALRGWRHEKYNVSQRYSDEPLMEIERAGSGLFGFIQYGVHINGYTRDKDGERMMWIGRRSKTKQTFPDMYDNMCAGGLSSDLGVTECVRKECQEEASVSDKVLEGLQFVGTISYFYEDDRGLFPECQFVYDLEVPADFQPVNADGEVESFHKVSMQEVVDLVRGSVTCPTSAGVCLDFLVRHGVLCPDEDPNVSFYVEQLHAPLQTYYAGK
ncbi:nudix hydrolase 20, chloroplastic [Aplysia californica]|uniref:Nudix hydrolase 20, chloroplastic n=1 Tax=Aplysia californica TaxID=6500 RepID=A0ABM1A9T3_APLCA|nr:nudix hydrolase 20, chloroplastic [Aplysia californica]